MLLCPVCRSQNMDTAKFCGNCGNPFPRPSAPTSSLINCAQGHIYSAVYEHCPYCPQTEGQDAEFITRVEEPITAVDQPSPAPFAQTRPPSDFATRIDTGETLFETSESPLVITPVAPPAAPAFAPTEISADVPPPENDSPSSLASPAGPSGWTSAGPFRPTEPDKPVPTNPAEFFPEFAPPPPPQAPTPGVDRRTIVMAEQAPQLRKSKGRIVGWLITYSHNPDGEDFRVYAGYNRLGANPVCDIVIEDETVSGSHSIIVYRDGRCLIKDDLSRNGTFVNGQEITEAHPLQSYDQIRIGNTYLTFVAAQRIP